MPARLARLPHPWNLNDLAARRAAVKAWKVTQERREEAFGALEICLSYLAGHPPRPADAPDVLGDRFHDGFFGLTRRFAADFPTIQDMSFERIRQWMRDNTDLDVLFGPGVTDPPAEAVEVFGRGWLRGTVRGATRLVTEWLIDAVGRPRGHDVTTSQDGLRLKEMLKSAVPRLHEDDAADPIGAIWTLDRSGQLDYFTRLENDPALPEQTRETAKGYRESTEIEREIRNGTLSDQS
ncbi:hypothetical protein [Allonocardiopsis opalescens]|uniref:hypothetical protein n=1 Tax=Allonocardiopsis opalescens TaxID=1144618 RepID=UPI0011B23AE4|nr:hypothetical protein [Allonocardiopsis opalescens]